MTRKFPIKSVEVGGARRNVHQIFCSECINSAHMVVSARGGAFHSDLVARHFRRKGWHIGKDHRRDICPACQKDARESRKANLTLVPAQEPEPMNKPYAPYNQPATTPTGENTFPSLVADPPREMSKEDKRIVYGKINEVYLDEVRGYDSGWTDERIAKDLGVPRAWVSTVRDEMFGAAEGNGEVLRIRMEMEELKAQVVKNLEQADSLRAQATEMLAQISELRQALAKVAGKRAA